MGKLFWSGVTSQGSGQGPSCRTEDSGRQLQIYTHVLQRRRMASDCWDSGSVGALLNRDTDPRWWWCLLLSRQKAQPVICSTTRTAELEHKESSHIIQIKLVSIHVCGCGLLALSFLKWKKLQKQVNQWYVLTIIYVFNVNWEGHFMACAAYPPIYDPGGVFAAYLPSFVCQCRYMEGQGACWDTLLRLKWVIHISLL